MSSPVNSSHRAGARPPANLASQLMSRRIRWLLVLILVGPFVALQAPLEVGRWKLAAAIQSRADGQKVRAYAELAEAMNWIPNRSKLYKQRAEWRLADGQRDEAFADADKMLEESTRGRVHALKEHIQFLELAGQRAEAVADYKRINEISERTGDPPRAIALNELAYFQALAKIELDDALKHVNEALELQPNEAAFLDTRAYVLHIMARNEEALVDMEKAIAKVEPEFEKLKRQFGTAESTASGKSQPESSPFVAMMRREYREFAVLYYHRSLIHQALGNQQSAAIDRNRVRQLIGREPDETLF